MQKKYIEENIFKWLMRIAAFTIVGILILILSSILYKGIFHLSWQMVTETPKGGFYLGKEGGILNAIIGSLYLALGSTVLAFVISYPIVIYINIYAKASSWWTHIIRIFFDILWGTPSIVFAALGFTVMIFLGAKTSLLAGILIVTLLIMPIIVRTLDEIIKVIPKGLYHASYALGITKWEMAIKVITKQSLPGIVTALLLAFGRAIGDAAIVMFTTGYTDRIPTSIFDSTATLPLAIFYQLGSSVEKVRGRAYASALILVLLVLCLSILSRYFTNKYNKFKVH